MSRRTPVPAGAAVAVTVALAAALASVLVGHQFEVLSAERRTASAAAHATIDLSDTLRAAMAEAATLASYGGRGSAGPQSASASVRALARDTGKPVLDEAGLIVVARYDSATAPETVQGRRDHVAGYLEVPIDLGVMVKSVTPSDGGVSVSGPTRLVASVPSSGPGSSTTFSLPFDADLAPGWSLTVWTAPGGVPPTAWLVAATLLTGGLVLAGWLTARHRDERRRQLELDAFQRTSATVAVLATLAQQSLDLGEALPGVTTELAAALGLRGLAVSAPRSGGESPIFVWGAPAEQGLAFQGQSEVAAGESLAFVLSQGGRTVAKMRVTAGRDLGPHDVRMLAAAGDVLTAALANADAFAQQAEVIRRMRAVDELKSAFLATASHELRTPVTAITGYAGLLHSNWDQLDPEESRDFAQRLDAVARRLARLVEEILDFSRLESGNGAEAEQSVVDLSETVASVLAEQTEMAPDHEVVLLAEPDLQVTGSRAAVERVVMNLVGNAAKYSPVGTTIRILTRESEEGVELVVEDEGPGIPAAERGQIFAPFYRGQGDQVVRTRGAGLGLAIVAEFAASMGGRIRVEEAPSGGASFVVSYPKVLSEVESESGAAHVQT